jgi:hypothetical protein
MHLPISPSAFICGFQLHDYGLTGGSRVSEFWQDGRRQKSNPENQRHLVKKR